MSYRYLEFDEPAEGVVRCTMSNPPRHTLLNPREALEYGLVHEVHPAEDLAQAAIAYAEVLAGRSPVGLAAAKAAIYGGVETDLEQGLLIEQAQFARCMGTRDAAVAMRSVLGGETWEWEGR